MPYQPGEVLLNKYKIEKMLGEGAFGEVYLATHIQLGAKRALKVLRRDAPGMGSTFYKDCQERFRREAQLGAAINNNNVIRVHNLEELDPCNPDGGYLLEMEYAPVDTLRARLETAREQKKPLEVEEALRIALDCAKGLAALHALDVVHRDVKPSNIFFGEDGRAKIGDLGLAQIPGGFSRRAELGSLAEKHPGTPAYMSPEQETTTQYLKTCSDIYSLGVVLFEMLTLRSYRVLPEGTRVSDVRPEVPREMDGLLVRMLAADPGSRPPNGQTVAAEIEVALQTVQQERLAREKETEAQRLHQQRAFEEARLAAEQKLRQEARQREEREAREQARREEAQRKAQHAAIQKEQVGSARISIPNWAWIAVLVLLAGIGIGMALGTGRWVSGPDAAPTPPQQQGSTRTREKDGMLEVYVPAGSFMMGSNDGNNDEKPVHEVYLDAYWIDSTEVTNAMYAAFLNDQGNQSEGGATWLDAEDEDARIHQGGGKWKADSGYEQHPVVEVSWYGARSYCEWAGGRLPTEAQWEKAARGTDGRTYPWGNQGATSSLANFDSKVGTTTPVGSYKGGASPNGALDMAGNVWEWVADRYGSYYYWISMGSNPTGPVLGNPRVLRGGSWYNYVNLLRSAYRLRASPVVSSSDFGFRCLRSE